MNEVLRQILDTHRVTNGSEEFKLKDAMDEDEGRLITRAFIAADPDISIEVGFAHGISALFACDVLAKRSRPSVHHVLDPFQIAEYHGVGLHNVAAAGFGNLVRWHEVRSEIALPGLLEAGTRIQAAIIDGFHTFDHTLIDFFYINKMLDVGGIIVLDDTRFPAVNQCARHILSYPAYELFGQSPDFVVSRRARSRRAASRAVPALRRSWDTPSAMAFRKIAPDERGWDWHAPF